MQSTVVTGSRTAAAGSGVQSITGAGFTPKAAIVLGNADGVSLSGSWGFLDDASAERSSVLKTTFTTTTGDLIQIENGANAMTAVGVLTSDGLDFTWTKIAAGLTAGFDILFLA